MVKKNNIEKHQRCSDFKSKIHNIGIGYSTVALVSRTPVNSRRSKRKRWILQMNSKNYW